MLSSVIIKAWNTVLGKDQNIQSSYNMVKTIDADHARIHDGKTFHYSEGFTTLANSMQTYLFIPGSDTSMHLRNFGFKSTDGPVHIELRENPFYDVNSLGTQVVPRNMNRGSDNVSSVALYRNPFTNVLSFGGELEHDLIESSAGGPIKASGAGGGSGVTEWVLPNNGNSYLLAFEPTVVTSGSFNGYWYEP